MNLKYLSAPEYKPYYCINSKNVSYYGFYLYCLPVGWKTNQVDFDWFQSDFYGICFSDGKYFMEFINRPKGINIKR